jgi:hypothetical protein
MVSKWTAKEAPHGTRDGLMPGRQGSISAGCEGQLEMADWAEVRARSGELMLAALITYDRAGFGAK